MNILNNYIVALECGNYERTQDFIKYLEACYHMIVGQNNTTNTILLHIDDYENIVHYSKNDKELQQELEVFERVPLDGFFENY